MVCTFPLSTAPDDFVNTLGIVLQFNGVFRSRPVFIMIEDDDVLENNETFFGNLEPIDRGVIVAPQTAAITIVEDNADSKWEVLDELWNQMYMYPRPFLWHSQNNGYIKEVVIIFTWSVDFFHTLLYDSVSTHIVFDKTIINQSTNHAIIEQINWPLLALETKHST